VINSHIYNIYSVYFAVLGHIFYARCRAAIKHKTGILRIVAVLAAKKHLPEEMHL